MKKRSALLALLLFTLALVAATSANSGKPEVTFSKNLAPIFYDTCVSCHQPGGLAPMSLLTYKDARPWAKAIKEKVAAREMPPWHADPQFGHFSNDRRLSQKAIETIVAWVDQGAKEGDPKDLPPQPEMAEGWHIGKPDVVLSMQQEHTIAATGPDDYLYFTIPTNFTEDKWVQASEIRPGNRKVVHHVTAFTVSKEVVARAISGRRDRARSTGYFVTEGTLRRVKMDAPIADDGCAAAEKGEAVANRRDSEAGLGSILAGYAPGKDWEVWPQGTATRIPAGSVIVFQTHYSKTTGKEEKDRTSIGLIFAKQSPDKIATTKGISNVLFSIPPGAESHQVTSCWTVPRDIQLIAYMPHMHLRGKDMKYEAVYPDGRRETLLWVPRYSFAWQEAYRLARPLTLPKGAKLVVTAHFDNSARNKWNPDPTKAVRWGDPTYDEMMIGWVSYLTDDPSAEPTSSTTSMAQSPMSPTFADLPYADKSPAQQLDLYLPTQSSNPSPLVIWIHGGGFRVGDKRSMPRRNFGPPPTPVGRNGPYQIQVPDVAALTAKGYAVVSLNYRLGASMSEAALSAMQDGKAAVRFLRANADKYRLDPKRFAVWGNSAGGYLAAMLGVTGDQPTVFDDPSLGNAAISSAVQAVVVWFGAEDRLLGEELRITKYLSTAKTLPAFLIANGDADPVISPAQAQRLHDALTKAGATSTLTILRGAGHEDPAFMATQMAPTFSFLDRTFGR